MRLTSVAHCHLEGLGAKLTRVQSVTLLSQALQKEMMSSPLELRGRRRPSPWDACQWTGTAMHSSIWTLAGDPCIQRGCTYRHVVIVRGTDGLGHSETVRNMAECWSHVLGSFDSAKLFQNPRVPIGQPSKKQVCPQSHWWLPVYILCRGKIYWQYFP